jgi:hypothetical protein
MGGVPPNETSSAPAPLPEEPRWRRVIRGPIPRWLFIAGLLLLAARIIWARPVDVEVIYDYGPARAGLVAAQMEYLDGNEALRRVRFDYATTAAGRTQLHAIQLPRGEHTVRIELTYRGEIPRLMRHGAMRPDLSQPTVELRRPLRVSGKGQSTIYISGR